MYHIKRNGKLFGPFDLDAVAKCINFEIFTAKDVISEDQVNWITIEEFQSTKKIEKQVVPPPTAIPGMTPGVTPRMAPGVTPRVVPGMMPGMAPYSPYGGTWMDSQDETETVEYSEKCRRHYALWWSFFGMFGAHDFYAGYKERGIIKLLLWFVPVVGWFAVWIWWLIDLFSVSCDAKGRPLALGGCKRVVYILLCVFLGVGGWHHLYTGHKLRWLVQWLILILLPIVGRLVVGLGLGLASTKSSIESMMWGAGVVIVVLDIALISIMWLVSLINAILTTTDADGCEIA